MMRLAHVVFDLTTSATAAIPAIFRTPTRMKSLTLEGVGSLCKPVQLMETKIDVIGSGKKKDKDVICTVPRLPDGPKGTWEVRM